jgi:hypothetical protein
LGVTVADDRRHSQARRAEFEARYQVTDGACPYAGLHFSGAFDRIR